MQKGKPYFADYGDNSPFTTPSGKIELFSKELALHGFDPLPFYEARRRSTRWLFSLALWSSPGTHLCQNPEYTPLLNDLYSENEIWVNEDAAKEQGFENGAYVWLENQDGQQSGPIKLKATQAIRQDAAYMVHGFGQKAPGLSNAHGKGASDTQLQSTYKLDPISGGAGMRVNFVRLLKEA